MPSKKILNKFIPYNDIWYINCFYHAFFPIINHFNKDIRAFICNNIYAYNYNSTNIDLVLKEVTGKSEKDILSSLDIGVTTKTESNNIISDLINSIDINNPVIIFIDCYYESIRPDAYKKHHCPHTLLIYGYDKNQKLFHIIEHQYRESLKFENRTISFEDVINSYDGYLLNLNNSQETPTYFEYFSQNSSYTESFSAIDPLQYQKTYINNYKSCVDKIFNGVGQLDSFIIDAEKVLYSNLLLEKHIDPLLNALNNIINLKNLERYTKLKLLNADFDFVNIDERIISNWSFFRGVIAKYKITGKYNLKSMEKSVEKLIDIKSLERVSYENLISYYLVSAD